MTPPGPMSIILRRLVAPNAGVDGSVRAPARAPLRARNWRRVSTRASIARRAAFSTQMGLQPELEQAKLPERRAVEVGAVLVRGAQHRLDHVLAEQPAVASRVRAQRVGDHLEHRPLEM